MIDETKSEYKFTDAERNEIAKYQLGMNAAVQMVIAQQELKGNWALKFTPEWSGLVRQDPPGVSAAAMDTPAFPGGDK